MGLKDAGFRPGLHNLADGSCVVSVSLPVSRLNIPVAALHAWDAKLLDPQMRLVLLTAFHTGYPQGSSDSQMSTSLLSSENARYVVGLSHKAKPVGF